MLFSYCSTLLNIKKGNCNLAAPDTFCYLFANRVCLNQCETVCGCEYMLMREAASLSLVCMDGSTYGYCNRR